MAGVDASPVLETSKPVLEAVAFAVKRSIVRDLHLAIDLCGNARVDAMFDKRLAGPVSAIAPIGKHGFGWRQGIDQHGSAFVVAGLSFCQHETDGTTTAIANGMEFGGQPATTASDTSG